MSETELLQTFLKERSEDAFAGLVRRYASLVYSTAKRRLADQSFVEDITQMVFIRLAQKPPNVQNPAQLAAWLHRTTVHVTIDLWRSETCRRARELQNAVMEPAAPETVVWEEISPKLDEALNQLADDDRQALLLRFFSQKTMRELGASLGISEDAAKMRVSRALDRLRRQIGIGATACTAAMLETLMVEHSVEAAPAPLMARLLAVKLPAAELTGASAGGLLGFLFRASNAKLAAGAAALALLAIVAVHRIHPAKPALVVVTTAAITPQTTLANSSTGNADDRQSETFIQTNLPQAAAVSSVNSNSNLYIHILDMETREPIAGARILAPCYVRSKNIRNVIDELTDNSGTAVIPRSLEGFPVDLIEMDAFAQGYIPKGIDPWGYHNRKIPSDYTIKLEPAMTVGGIVEDEEGQPVSGVRIVETQPMSDTGQDQLILFQSVTNNSDGSWSYTYVPRYMTNQIPFILTKPGYATTFIVVPVSQVGLEHLVFVINKGFTIAGRVTDSQQEAIANASVKNLAMDHYSHPQSFYDSTTTDENGSFTFSNIWGYNTDWDWQKRTIVTNENGEVVWVHYFSEIAALETNAYGVVSLHETAGDNQPSVPLVAEAYDYAPQTNLLALTDATGTNVANFTLSPGNIVRGRLLDDAGHPVTNAVVEARWGGSDETQLNTWGDEWQTHTDANGQFEWDSAPAGSTLFNFIADGYELQMNVPLVADGGEHDITLKRTGAP